MRFSLDGKNYLYDYEHDKAPNFCAVHYLNSLSVSVENIPKRAPSGWRTEWYGEWKPSVERPVKDLQEAAVNTIKECLMGDAGTKLLLCDKVGGRIHEYLIKHLEGISEIKVPSPIGRGAIRTYVVEIGTPYKNYNTNREVIECCIRRTA